MKTHFFPQWRRQLAALGAQVKHFRQQSLQHLEILLAAVLPIHLLSQADEGPNSRQRIYTLRRTFFGFLSQVLTPGTSCREIVRQIQALFTLHGGRPVDESTSPYCQARGRLPLELLAQVRGMLGAQAEKGVEFWRGLCPKVLDGTTLSMPDTAENQAAYPQSKGQKPGCGFPLMKIVGVFSLTTGALLDYAKGNQHKSEQTLVQKLLGHFKEKDLIIADRGFSSYVLMGLFLSRGVHGLFRLNAARSQDLRRGKRLGKNDRLRVWHKPSERPPYLPKAIWKGIPQTLSVRVIRFQLAQRGYRSKSVTLVTTLVDPKAYPAVELALLYARRWKIELWFRDIKTTMGMEVLRCLTPKMVHKEVEMFFIAYNLIRCQMGEASVIHDVPLERLSFKGTVDAVRQFSLAIAQARSKKKQQELITQLSAVIAKDTLPGRPGRREPRALKRRPKHYPLLNRPRDKFKEIPHPSRYRKNDPEKP